MMTTSSHTPPLLAEKVTALYHLSKLWLKPLRCASLSRFRRKNLLSTLRKIAAEMYSNARLQDRYLCSQNSPCLAFPSRSYVKKCCSLSSVSLSVNSLFPAWGTWGSFACGKNRTSHATRVLLLVLLISQDLWTSFSRAFRLISFILLVSSKGLGLCCADFFAE